MTYAADQIIIENRFESMFTVTQVKYANTDVFEPTPDESWCELEVDIASSINAEIGGNYHRYAGVISVNVYVPTSTGTVAGKLIADAAAAVFRDASFSGIICRSPTVTNVGVIQQWYAINMTVQFYRDKNF